MEGKPSGEIRYAFVGGGIIATVFIERLNHKRRSGRIQDHRDGRTSGTLMCLETSIRKSEYKPRGCRRLSGRSLAASGGSH